MAGLGILQLSAVREMANIGLGHATKALSDMTGHNFNMEVPTVETVSLEAVPNLFGDPEALNVGIYMQIEGDITGHIAFIFPWASAQVLWRALLGQTPETIADVDELAASVILEVGNIINGGFLNAIANMTDLRLLATPPLVSIDTSHSVTSSIVAEAESSDVVALAVETKIFDETDLTSEGYFLCIPSAQGLNLLLARLGVTEAA